MTPIPQRLLWRLFSLPISRRSTSINVFFFKNWQLVVHSNFANEAKLKASKIEIFEAKVFAFDLEIFSDFRNFTNVLQIWMSQRWLGLKSEQRRKSVNNIWAAYLSDCFRPNIQILKKLIVDASSGVFRLFKRKAIFEIYHLEMKQPETDYR